MNEMSRERSWIAEWSVGVRTLLAHLPPNRRPDPNRLVVRIDRTRGEIAVYDAEARWLGVLHSDGTVHTRSASPFGYGLYFIHQWRDGQQVGHVEIWEATVR